MNAIESSRRNQAFAALYKARHQRLYHFVLARVGHGDDARDIAQQAFADALQACRQFRGESELHTWVYGIALNLARNHLARSPQRRYAFEGDEAIEAMPAHAADPCERVSAAQTAALLLQALGELTPELRDTLLSVAWDEASYADTAAAMRIPVGTVRSRVSRARAVLGARLA
jgi:RNA polymerase sigma-70 factor (ECF subfamily)